MNFTGKVALVTGASSGMGRAAAEKLAQFGAKVMINYAQNEKGAKETLAAIEKAGGQAAICQANVTKLDEVERLVQTTVKEFGKLDILINNAGTTRFIPFSDLDAATEEVWMELYSTNVIGAFMVARAAAREMRKTGGGVIVNNASFSGQRPTGSSIPYCASKAAMIQLNNCLAKALAPDIRVNSVSPGYIEDTGWHPKRPGFAGDKDHQNAAEVNPLKKNGTAEDVANAIVFLASDEAGFCTGMDIRIDGGRFYTA